MPYGEVQLLLVGLLGECNRPKVPDDTTIYLSGQEQCGGVGIPVALTIYLERDGVIVPESIAYVLGPPQDLVFLSTWSSIPCVAGSYVGRVTAELTGYYGPGFDIASTPVTQITC